MKYMLVIQFSESLYGDLDWIIAIEDKFTKILVNADVDGHDAGNGGINFYILTNNPMATFETIKKILEEQSVLQDAKAAYRDLKSENFHCLWPIGLAEFNTI